MPRPPKNEVFTKAEVGRRVRELRASRGLTQAELARKLGMPQPNVSEIERGGRGLTVHQAVRLAKALGVTTDAILQGATEGTAARPGTSLKLRRRLQKIEELPEARQRVVLKLLDALLYQEAS